MSEQNAGEMEAVSSPGSSHSEAQESESNGLAQELAELRGRVRALELQHLQLRTKYIQTQVLLLRYERARDQEWAEAEDADVQVLNEQADMLKDRILAYGGEQI